MRELCCRNTRGKASSEFVCDSKLPHYAPDLVIEPCHLDISIDATRLDTKTVTCSVKQTFAYLKDVPTTKRSVKVNAVSFFDLQVIGADHVYDGQIITVTWDTPFTPGEKRIVTFNYTIKEPISGLYFNVPNKEFPDRVLHCITDHETERARFWLPCIDFPASRTTLEFSIKTLPGILAFANGKVVSETVDQYRVTRYALDYPCPSYLICWAAGDFHCIDDESVDGIPIRYIVQKNVSLEDTKKSFGRTPAMMRWIQKKLDFPFPWPRYDQIVSHFVGGAMENIGLVTWLDEAVLPENVYEEWKDSTDSTNIHEMAHTYFGDLLVIKHFEHVWLKESWATYFSALWLEDNVSYDEFRYNMFSCAERYISETGSYMRPMVTRKYDCSWSMFDAHTYPGGACRLHMLRKYVGDAAFWKGVQDYVKTFAKKTVETKDFRQCIEKASGFNLVPFFEQWFYSKGYPQLQASWEYNLEEKKGTLTLKQTQKETIFDLNVLVHVKDENGVSSQTAVFANAETAVKLHFTTSESHAVLIDPFGDYLFSLDFNPGVNVLEKNILQGDIPNRIRAYRELIKNGSTAALDKVKHIFEEKFYGVRVQVAKALSSADTFASCRLLAQILEKETNHVALRSIVSVCTVKSDDIATALYNVTQRPNVPGWSHSLALTRLGKYGDKYLDYLLQVATSDKIGPYGYIRQGVLKGLGETRDVKAFDFLLDAFSKQPESCRKDVLIGLRTCAPWQDNVRLRKAIDFFEQKLKDPLATVRLSAIRSLVVLESKASHSKIESTKTTFDERDIIWIDRQIKALNSSASGPGLGNEKIKALNKLVEALEKRLKTLEDKK